MAEVGSAYGYGAVQLVVADWPSVQTTLIVYCVPETHENVAVKDCVPPTSMFADVGLMVTDARFEVDVPT